MSPRKRKYLNPRSRDFGVRFGLHIRQLLSERELPSSEFRSKLKRAGLDVAEVTVRKWLSGDRLPRPEDFEAIGKALDLDDYRDAMPPPK